MFKIAIAGTVVAFAYNFVHLTVEVIKNENSDMTYFNRLLKIHILFTVLLGGHILTTTHMTLTQLGNEVFSRFCALMFK